jgi:uncharacterized repeat protein (TIGR01451 family)
MRGRAMRVTCIAGARSIIGRMCYWGLAVIFIIAGGGVEAKEAATGQVTEGDIITYYYAVSNIGNVNLTDIDVIDDKVVPVYVSGDANGDGWLNLSEVWLYKALYQVTKGDMRRDIVNTATATARDPCGKPVDDQDIEVVKTGFKDGEPSQYGQFCEAQKVSGTGVIDVSTSIYDKSIALEYYNMMNGDGDIELDQEQTYSQNADKLKRNISSVNGGNESALNLYENTKLTYSGDLPLQGEKYLHSKAFYGGIGAQVRETFSVQEMEKKEVSFFAQTMPYQPYDGLRNFQKGIESVGRDTEAAEELMRTREGVSDPAHLVGLQTSNTFNGSWGTEARLHRILYKDIDSREMFKGKFEAEKEIKFHEYPVEDKRELGCAGIDC